MMGKRIGAMILALASCAAQAAPEVNLASETDLDALKGLGPGSTASILQARAQRPFSDWSDLMSRVKGIKRHKAEQLSRQGLTVNGLPYAQAAR
jgi:competence protein ComEA